MALKLRTNHIHPVTYPVGSTEITANAVVKFTSSALAVATAASAAFIGVIIETGVANGSAAVESTDGAIVLCNAHDSSITEGEWVVPAAAGRVDGIGTLTTATQYVLGIALQASTAQDDKIPVQLHIHIATKAAS